MGAVPGFCNGIDRRVQKPYLVFKVCFWLCLEISEPGCALTHSGQAVRAGAVRRIYVQFSGSKGRPSLGASVYLLIKRINQAARTLATKPTSRSCKIPAMANLLGGLPFPFARRMYTPIQWQMEEPGTGGLCGHNPCLSAVWVFSFSE